MADIREVAAEAGVSTATVSRVVNGSKKVSDETRKKVEEAIRKTNYSTNFLGLTLRKQKTNTILVLVPTMTNEFVPCRFCHSTLFATCVKRRS